MGIVFSGVIRVMYKTRFGICFYDREREVDCLERVVGRGDFVVVWGPKNIGKSELLKYFSYIVSGRGWVVYYIDAREYIARKTIEVYPSRDFLGEFLDMVRDIVGVPSYLLELFEKGIRFGLEKKASGILWVFDEPHYLSNVKPFLESIVKNTIYTSYGKPVSAIISVSDGWFITSDAMHSLLDYGVKHLFVDELDIESFKILYRDIVSITGINTGLDVETIYREYTGGNPGYLIDLLKHSSTNEWVNNARYSLINKVVRIERGSGFPREQVLRYIASLPKTINIQHISVDEYSLVEKLLENNIVYYDIACIETIVKPVLPVYKLLAKELLKEYKETKQAHR